jgi:hypothetical protein
MISLADIVAGRTIGEIEAILIAQDFLEQLLRIPLPMAMPPPDADVEFNEFLGEIINHEVIQIKMVSSSYDPVEYTQILKQGLHLILDGSPQDSPELRAQIDNIQFGNVPR